MNRTIQAHGAAGDAGASGIEAAGRLDEIRGPVTVAWGDADLPAIIEEARALAAALGPARARSHVLAGVAHLPGSRPRRPSPTSWPAPCARPSAPGRPRPRRAPGSRRRAARRGSLGG